MLTVTKKGDFTMKPLMLILGLICVLIWLTAIAVCMCFGAQRSNQDKHLSGFICFALAILLGAAGCVGWHHLSSQPQFAYLRTPICSSCNSTMRLDDKFCSQCGEAAVQNLCIECHSEYIPGDEYCSSCGVQLSDGSD